MLSYGKIVQVSGPVVDCEFQEGQLPKIREAPVSYTHLTLPTNREV